MLIITINIFFNFFYNNFSIFYNNIESNFIVKKIEKINISIISIKYIKIND